MTKRTPVSAIQNKFYNAEQLDDKDLSLEQDYNNTIQSSIINNHIGTGVLQESLTQTILFDSSKAEGFLDGVIVSTQNQPSDNNFGNILSLSLTNSVAAGKKTVKVAIIGLDFQSNLQFETFVFSKNEILIGKKHFTKILLILINDLIGNPDLSFNLGGTLLIKEASPLALSRDTIMVAQDIEPNIFFRDFFVDGFASLNILLTTALSLYNVDSLNIFTSELTKQSLLVDDVTTQIGEKFKASTNNIQKISLLLSVQNAITPSDLAWTGDLIASIYPLQSTIESQSDIAPNLQIDFAPVNIPLAQISFNYSSILAAGVLLDTVAQPVDFIFSNTNVAGGNIIIPGNYYAITLKRSGSANKCDILMSCGNNRISDSRLTVFSGNLWVDIPEQNLWFKVYTDAAKISDGQGYESGFGLSIPKISIDATSKSTIDYTVDKLQFVGNDIFRAVISASTQELDPVPDQITGNPVTSHKQFAPKIDLFNSINIASLESVTDPFIIGAISDQNIKYFDLSLSTINSKLYSATIVRDEIFIKIVDDATDTKRYDTSVNSLVTNLLNGNFIAAKIVPDSTNSSIYYKLKDAQLLSMMHGDVNGDGIIDDTDTALLNSYIGYNLNIGLPTNATVTTNTIVTTYTNGYRTYTNPFLSASSISWQLVDPTDNFVIKSGTDGYITPDPNDYRLAAFASASADFDGYTGISSDKLVILTNTNVNNYGGFDIIANDSISETITIRKIYLNSENILQMFRSDLDGDFYISSNDQSLLQAYIDRKTSQTSTTPTITPANTAPTSIPFSKIGTRFNVIKFKLESFVDRSDEYASSPSTRSTTVHINPDVFLSDGYYAQHDFYHSPSNIIFTKQLSWSENLVITTTATAKSVPAAFTSNSGFITNNETSGVITTTYPVPIIFDPGLDDFFVPNNLIIGESGQIKTPAGDFYKIDFEVGTIVLEIPNSILTTDKTINLIADFIADKDASGLTRSGFPAMKFSDNSTAQLDSLSKNQLQFNVAVQSFYPSTTNAKIGVYIDYTTGLLNVNFTNIQEDPVLQTLNTKIQVTVFLKKAGFYNTPLIVNSTKISNLLNVL